MDPDKLTEDKPFKKCLTADQYTTTLGSYCAWSRNVDLGPWNNSIPVPPEDSSIYNYYDALQYTLFETNYPETEDRTHVTRQQTSGSSVSIALLSSPVECMAILLEGARQCPDDMLLVLSTSWLQKERSVTDPGLYSLFIHKAITFDRAGRTFLDSFDPPRKATYFVNFFTKGCTDGQRSDGESIEENLDCPMSDSLKLVSMVDDKVLTRLFMAQAGMKYPETLAFIYGVPHRYPKVEFEDITIVKLESTTGVQNLVKSEISRFLEQARRNVKKVVVKPSGVMWHGSMGVSYHPVEDEAGVFTAVTDLLENMTVNNGVLIDGFYEPLSYEDTDSDVADLSFRLRATVCRGLENRPITTTLVCGVGDKHAPINGDNTQPQSFETTMQIFGLSEHTSCLREETMRCSEKVLQRIIDYEDTLTFPERGCVGAQTDVIGIDFVIGVQNDVISPIGIEVNSHDCTINCQLYEFINPCLSGKTVRPLVETMIARSQEYALQGTTIAVIGSGGTSKRFIWPDAKKYGVKVILVDEFNCDPVARDQCFQFIPYDFTEHRNDTEHAYALANILSSLGGSVNGCCTFWEDCVPLTAKVCSIMGLPGAGVEGAVNAKQKSRTHQTLLQRTGDIPHFPRSYLYAGKSAKIKNTADIMRLMPKFEKPCMLKLEFGSSAVGVKLVRDEDECEEEYLKIRNRLCTEADHPGIGLGHGNKMFLMEYFSGTEHDVDLVIFERKIIAAFISDNGPTREGTFTETAACMPTGLPPDKQGQLITAAYQCCIEIGLINGVFNVEMIMTKKGPKLLEINARMGGYYLRDWIKRCYGVDLMKVAFLISCGIKPILPKPSPSCHIMGVMCVPSVHGHLFRKNMPIKDQILTTIGSESEIRYNAVEEEYDLNLDADLEEPICNIAVVEDSKEAAHSHLMDLCKALGIQSEKYDVEDLTKTFMTKWKS